MRSQAGCPPGRFRGGEETTRSSSTSLAFEAGSAGAAGTVEKATIGASPTPGVTEVTAEREPKDLTGRTYQARGRELQAGAAEAPRTTTVPVRESKLKTVQ